ncbi:MAG: hypothetical protein QOH14_146, partial [Pseudonocardiales bacterium]|nr:hypothetical protein [Pseudonocardiales bacterium]
MTDESAVLPEAAPEERESSSHD